MKIIVDFDDVLVSMGLFFKKDAKLILRLLIFNYGYDIEVATSRGTLLYPIAKFLLWHNRVGIQIHKSGRNGNKAKYCQGAFMFVDNHIGHVKDVLSGGGVEKVCLFLENEQKKPDEIPSGVIIVSSWWDIFWEATAK